MRQILNNLGTTIMWNSIENRLPEQGSALGVSGVRRVWLFGLCSHLGNGWDRYKIEFGKRNFGTWLRQLCI